MMLKLPRAINPFLISNANLPHNKHVYSSNSWMGITKLIFSILYFSRVFHQRIKIGCHVLRHAKALRGVNYSFGLIFVQQASTENLSRADLSQSVWPVIEWCSERVDKLWRATIVLLNIKTVYPKYRDSNYKDKTTVLSLWWESLFLVRRNVFTGTSHWSIDSVVKIHISQRIFSEILIHG